MTDEELWREEFRIIGDNLALWNQNVIPWMEQRGDAYKRAAHAEAKRKHWRYSKGLHAYIDSVMPEERARVERRLWETEITRWLRRAQNMKHIAQHGWSKNKGDSGLVPTQVEGVFAYFEHENECTDKGYLMILDARHSEVQRHIWELMPKWLFDRLFAPGAARSLNDIYTIYAGQEITAKQFVEHLHAIETGLSEA